MIPFGHTENPATGGIQMWVGDENESRWRLEFPSELARGYFPTPPTVCYIPTWIFEVAPRRAKKARQDFGILADLEFQNHNHENCGDIHNRIVRHGVVVLDVPCCTGK